MKLEELYIIGDMHLNFTDKKARSDKYTTMKEQSEERMILWNEKIKPTDTVIINGDFIDFEHLGGTLTTTDEMRKYVEDIISRLNGIKYLILGNHDRPFVRFYPETGIHIIPFSIIIDDFFMVSHEPMLIPEGSVYVNIHAHVHNSPMYQDYTSVSFCTSAKRPLMDDEPIKFTDIKKLVSKKYYQG